MYSVHSALGEELVCSYATVFTLTPNDMVLGVHSENML